MTTTFTAIENIFNTLPISYYLGRKISVSLSTGDESYFDMLNDKIVVGAKDIIDAVSNIENENIDIEEIVRGLLYHEVSHAILTPKNLFDGHNRREVDIINIVEDERIENLMKDFYMKVNFKRNIILLNNYVEGQEPKNARQAFYFLVRYRKGTEEQLRKLNNLLFKYNKINASSAHEYSYIVDRYSNDIIAFYEWFIKDYEKEQNNQQQQSNSNDNEQSNSNDNNNDSNDENSSTPDSQESDTPEQPEHKDDEDSATIDGMSTVDVQSILDSLKDAVTDNQAKSAVEVAAEELAEKINNNVTSIIPDSIDVSTIVKTALSEVINHYYDAEIVSKCMKIVDSKLKKRNNQGSAIAAYSGRISPKQVGTRDDYRWWTKQSVVGNIRRYSKLHFNLYIDNSGSFRDNSTKMNTVIRALEHVSNVYSDFSFDVITLNTELVEWPNTHHEFRCSGCNRIPKELKDVVRRHLKSQTTNYNIVLFDGDAHSGEGRCTPSENDNLRFFDMPNTIIISDDENKKYFDKCIKGVHVVYTKNYYNTFVDHLINLLDRAA